MGEICTCQDAKSSVVAAKTLWLVQQLAAVERVEATLPASQIVVVIRGFLSPCAGHFGAIEALEVAHFDCRFLHACIHHSGNGGVTRVEHVLLVLRHICVFRQEAAVGSTLHVGNQSNEDPRKLHRRHGVSVSSWRRT